MARLLVLMVVGLSFAARADGVDGLIPAKGKALKPGLWLGVTTQVGVAPKPEIVDTSQMSPGQRERVEAEQQERKKKKKKAATDTALERPFCVNEAWKAASDEWALGLVRQHDGCTFSVVSRTADRAVTTIECAPQYVDLRVNTTLSYQVPSPEALVGTAKSKAVIQRKTLTSTVTFSGRWVSATCPQVL